MYAVMWLNVPANDIVSNVSSARVILYKNLASDTIFSPFEVDISQALSLDDIQTVSLPSQLHFDGVEDLRIQDLTIAQLARELEGNSEKLVTNLALFLFIFIIKIIPT